MPIRDLPNNPRLEHLRNQAKALRRRVRAADAEALAIAREFHPRHPPEPAAFTLADAQLVTARRYGFASWPRLREHLDVVTTHARLPQRESPATDSLADRFLRLACLTYGDDRPAHVDQARALLAEHPEVATASIHTMAAAGEAEAAAAPLSVDPPQVDVEGGPHRWPPLLYATYSRLGDTLAVARLLLAHGADPNAGYLWAGAYPFTALTGAFGGGEANQPPHPQWQELARLLLAAGADPNDSQTLYNRGLSGGIEHVKLLLEFGLGQGSGGPWHARLGPAGHPTPAQLLQDELLKAAKHGDRELARLMIAQGVDVNGRGTEHPTFGGHTAYELAVLAGNPEIAEDLAAAGATRTALDPMQELIAACMRADRAAVDRLRADFPGLVATTIEREPYLIGHAAAAGRVETVRLLAELGFDVNLGEALVFRDTGTAQVATLLSGLEPRSGLARRTSALHLAAWNGDLPMARTLVELGADLSIRDCEHDSTPLGWAEYNHQHDVAAYLRGAG